MAEEKIKSLKRQLAPYGDQLTWYEDAKKGDYKSLKWLLDYRRNYEYEKIELSSLEKVD